MDFSGYLDKTVKIDLSSGYYYCGRVIDVDEKFMKLIDKNSSHVVVSINDIILIKEVELIR